MNRVIEHKMSNGIDDSNRSFLEDNTKTTFNNGKSKSVPEWLTLWAIGSVHLYSAMCISLQAPFYPREAESKGATATEYGLVFGIFEFVAMISSPFLGKYIGGFVLPFLVMGIAMILGVVLIYTVLPSVNPKIDDNVSMLDVLKIPAILLDSACTIGIAITMGYLAATLEPHIREFGLTAVQNGFVFVTSGLTYAVAAPLVGRICDRFDGEEKLDKLKRTLSLGTIFIITSYVLIGPCPFTIIPKSLILCILGLLIHGLGISCLMTPTFIDSISSAVSAGMPNNLSTYGVVSGIWSTSFAIGAFIGPSVSGWLFDLVGFQYGMLFVITLHFSLFLGITLFLALKKKNHIEVIRNNSAKRSMDNSNCEKQYEEPLVSKMNSTDAEMGSYAI